MNHFLWEIRPYFRQVAGQLVLGSLAGIVMNTAIVLPAILLGRAIDTVLALERGEADVMAVAWAALLFVGGTLLTEAPRFFKRYWLMTANARIRANVRADALRGVLAWPMERLQITPVGDIMARATGDVDVMGVGIREFTVEMWDTVLFSISIVVALFLFDAGLTVMALLPVPAAMALAHASGRWVSARTAAARQANAVLTAGLQEYLSGVRLVRLFGRAATIIGRVAALSTRQADANLAVSRLRNGLQPVYSSMMAAGVILVVWQGGERVVAGAMTVGAFVAYIELYLRFVERGFRIPQLLNSIHSGASAYARIRPLLAPPLAVKGEPPLASFRPGHVAAITRPLDAPAPLPTGPLAVSLEDVTFRYPGAPTPALEHVSLDIPAGAFVAVTGPVGSGKSALARALLGLYPLESGTVRLGGRPLDAIPAYERTRMAGYLPQDGYLFSGSVRENILLFAETGREGGGNGRRGIADPTANVARAVRLSALEDDLRGFPAGFDTEIGELGIRVSGGQRQRTALARAMTSDGVSAPGLLVLDDPFSAVDLATEAKIVEGLRDAFGPAAPADRRATVLLFSHRLAAFPSADLVVVLERGEIVEQGTHDELMAAARLYARIFRAQRLVEQAGHPAEVIS